MSNVALRVAIIESGLTQRQIAKDCSIAESRFSLIVRRRRMPSDDERAAIAAALGRAEDDLFPWPYNQHIAS